MNNQTYLDLSLLKNQNTIATKLAFSFTIEELEQISIKNISFASSKRDISQPINSVYVKKFEDDKTFEILDILVINVYPPIRFINIRFIKGEYFQMDFKCKYSKKISSYLNFVIANAINFLKYRSEHDYFLIKGHIYDNFSKMLSKQISLGGLEELRFICSYFNTNTEILTSDNYSFNFTIEDVKFDLSTTPDLIRIGFEGKKKSDYIFLYRNKIGISSINLIVEKTIKIKCKEETGKS